MISQIALLKVAVNDSLFNLRRVINLLAILWISVLRGFYFGVSRRQLHPKKRENLRERFGSLQICWNWKLYFQISEQSGDILSSRLRKLRATCIVHIADITVHVTIIFEFRLMT
jgi:hypothetical protein